MIGETGESDESSESGESGESGEASESGEPIDPALCVHDGAGAWASAPPSIGNPYGEVEAECLVTEVAEDATGWTITLDCTELRVFAVRFDADPKPSGPPVIVGEQLGLSFWDDQWPHGGFTELALRSLDDGSLRLLSAGGNDGSEYYQPMLFELLPSAPIDIEVTPDVCTVEVCGLSRRYASLQFSTSEESVLLLPANSFAEIGVERRFAVWGTSYHGICGPSSTETFGWVTIAALGE